MSARDRTGRTGRIRLANATPRAVEIGLYLHLPYCRSLCPYCAFAKAPLHRAEPRRLLRALSREWEMARAAGRPWGRPRTVYFGGGTPTALDEEALSALFHWTRRSFELDGVREWTVEANPEGLTREKLALLRESGADRLSLGIQSLDPAVLKRLGRIHTVDRSLEAIDDALKAGFHRLSADLIVGVPGEHPEGVLQAVETLVARGVTHLSIYSLQVEEGTPLAGKVARGALPTPDEDAAAERYEAIAVILARAGYRHYEVASWAKPGFESKHNQGYWTRRPYLGLGPGAHSFDGVARWRNAMDVTRYFEHVEEGVLPREHEAPLEARTVSAETILLGLRRARGLKRRALERLAGLAGSPLQEWSAWAQAAGAIRLDPPGRIRPTERGLLVAHEIASDLLLRLERAGAAGRAGLTPAAPRW